MNRLTKCVCVLPAAAKSMCEMGCIYREKAFRHLACPLTIKTDPCAAPCPPNDCTCKNEPATVQAKKLLRNEVFLL